LASLLAGGYPLAEYFAGYNARNETIPFTFPRAVVYIPRTLSYIPFRFLPNNLIGRAPRPTSGQVVVGEVIPNTVLEPIIAPLRGGRPTEAEVHALHFRGEAALVSHRQTFDNASWAFVSYDHTGHTGPLFYSEVWIWPTPPTAIQTIIDLHAEQHKVSRKSAQ